MTRRFFLFSAVIGLVATLLGRREEADVPVRRLMIGKLGDFPLGDTELPLYRLLVRRESVSAERQRIAVMSMVCTHQTCLIRTRPEGFLCPCHGSEFSPDGEVQTGPATEDLRWLRVSISEDSVWVFPDDSRGWPHWERIRLS